MRYDQPFIRSAGTAGIAFLVLAGAVFATSGGDAGSERAPQPPRRPTTRRCPPGPPSPPRPAEPGGRPSPPRPRSRPRPPRAHRGTAEPNETAEPTEDATEEPTDEAPRTAERRPGRGRRRRPRRHVRRRLAARRRQRRPRGGSGTTTATTTTATGDTTTATTTTAATAAPAAATEALRPRPVVTIAPPDESRDPGDHGRRTPAPRGPGPLTRVPSIPPGGCPGRSPPQPARPRRERRPRGRRRGAGRRPQAFRLLVEREGPSVVAACARVLGDRAEAEDVAQEAFVIAYRSLATWRGDGRVRGLAGADRRAPRGAARSRSASRSRGSTRSPPRRTPRARERYRSTSRTDAVDPAHTLLRIGARRAGCGRPSATLDEPYREVVALRFFAERSLAEIAEATDRPLGTVKTHLHRGLARLRRALEEAEA